MANREVVIFGVGDFARIASVYLDEDSEYRVAAFTVHDQYRNDDELLGKPVIAFERLADQYPPDRCDMFVAVGFSKVNRVRAALYDECKAKGYRLISYVCSKAMTWGHLEMGDNCFVFESNVLQPFVKLGNDVILWSGNHIGHDTTIGDHVFIASHAVISGNVEIGDYTFIGVNATLRDGIKISPSSVIGAGVTILRDTVPEGVYRATDTEPMKIPSSKLRNF